MRDNYPVPMSLPKQLQRHSVVPASEVQQNAGVTSFMSSHERKGEWTMPRHMRVACVMGAIVVDLREARIPSGESEIEIVAVLGSVEIMIPPGVRVEMLADGFMGSVEYKPDPTFPTTPDSPCIRITGTAYVASVEVSVRLAWESARDTKKRLRAAR